MALNIFSIAQTVRKLLRFNNENRLSGSTFECECETANVKVEPTISSSKMLDKISFYKSFKNFWFVDLLKPLYWAIIYCRNRIPVQYSAAFNLAFPLVLFTVFWEHVLVNTQHL